MPAARALSHKSTLIGIAVPTPTKDGAPIPLADTPPEGFQKQKLPKTDAPPPSTAPVELPPNITPRGQAPVITQDDIAAAKAAAQMDPAKVDASTRVTRRDLPIHSSAARASIPGVKPAALGSSSTSSRYLTIGFAIAGLVLAGRFLMRKHDGAGADTEAPPTGVQLVPQATDKGTAVVPPSSEPAPSLAPPASAATTEGAPGPSAAPAAPADDKANPSATAPPGTRVVIVTLSPPGARLFRRGKPIGSSPVRIELPPDEKKRAYEVGMPGFVTRRLVVDGSKPEIFIGLKPAAQ